MKDLDDRLPIHAELLGRVNSSESSFSDLLQDAVLPKRRLPYQCVGLVERLPFRLRLYSRERRHPPPGLAGGLPGELLTRHLRAGFPTVSGRCLIRAHGQAQVERAPPARCGGNFGRRCLFGRPSVYRPEFRRRERASHAP